MRRSLLLVPSLAVIAALTAACQTTSVVRTMKVEPAAKPPAGRPYLVYSLATTQIIITVKKAGGADKPDPSPTNVNTVSIQNWADGKPQVDDSQAADKPKKPTCAKLRTLYEGEAAKRLTLAAQYDARVAEVNRLVEGPLPESDRQKVRDLLAEQDTAALEDTANLEKAKTLKDQFDDSACDAFVIDVSQKVVADPTQLWALYVDDAAFAADKLAIKVDSNGFLSSITSSSDEKTGEVVSAGVKSIANVAGFVSGGGLSGVSSMKAASSSSAYLALRYDSKIALPNGLAQLLGQYSEIEAPPQKRQSKPEFLAEIAPALTRLRAGGPSALPDLPAKPPEYPLLINVNKIEGLKPFGAGSGPVAQTAEKGDIYGAFKYEINCAPIATDLPISEKTSKQLTPTSGDIPEGRPGVTVSGQRTCQIEISKGATVVSRTVFLAADSRSTQIVPISRTSLIARTDGYEFTDGRMTSLSYDKPSNALAVVSLPLRVTGEAISGFSTAIQGQQGLIKAQSDLVSAKAGQTKADAEVYNAKAALLKAQTDLLAAQAAADKARKDQAAAAAQP